MTENRKLNRLRSLEARIGRARGQKRLELLKEYDRVRRSLGRMVWVPIKHMGIPVEPIPDIKIDGTYKSKQP